MNIKEYLKKKIKENGFDGIVNYDRECFCEVDSDNFMYCDDCILYDCILGKKQECNKCKKANILDCATDKFSVDAEEINYCILPTGENINLLKFLRKSVAKEDIDGFFNNNNDCSCFIEDNFPCGEVHSECVLAYIHECSKCNEEKCYLKQEGNQEYCFSSVKQTELNIKKL